MEKLRNFISEMTIFFIIFPGYRELGMGNFLEIPHGNDASNNIMNISQIIFNEIFYLGEILYLGNFGIYEAVMENMIYKYIYIEKIFRYL